MFYGAHSGCNVLTLTQLQPSLFDSFFSEGVGWLPGTHLTHAFFLTGPYLACYLLRPSWIWNFYRSPCKREPIAILYLALLSFRLHCLSLWRRLKSRQLKSPLFSSTKERLAALEHGGLILSHKKQVTQLWIEDLGTLSNNQGELYKPIQSCFVVLFVICLCFMYDSWRWVLEFRCSLRWVDAKEVLQHHMRAQTCWRSECSQWVGISDTLGCAAWFWTSSKPHKR